MDGTSRVPKESSQRAAAVAELGLQLAEPTSTNGLELQVVRRVSELVGDAAALWRRDDEGHLELVATTHHDPLVRAHLAVEAPGASHSDLVGVLPHVWRSAQVLRLDADDLESWLPQMQPAYQRYAELFGMVSLLVVPLRVRGRVVALLGVSRDRHPGLDDDDEAFVLQIGAVVAVALDNERLLRQVRSSLAERDRAHLAAHRAALHDPLTGLPNRRLLLERLTSQSSREDWEVLLLIVDLDEFKDLNDAYGHSAGDAALVEVARRLEDVVRRSQLGPRTTLARLGGDEFALLLALEPGAPTPRDLPVQVIRSLAAPLAGLPEVTLGASVGLARGPGAQASTLMRHADIAMYRAKRTRTGWAEYEADRDVDAEGRLRALSLLDAALAGRTLHLAYQPVVPRGGGAQGRRLVEALVRWDHPERGPLLPGAFLPLAEQSGRMGLLTEVVLDLALVDLRRWHRDGLDVQVSVNVGADVLARPGFLAGLAERLEAAGLQPRDVCLELTESEVLSPEGPALLAQVRATGTCVALDDFGTGYSSLAYLADLSLDRLKLDRSFVRRLGLGNGSARFVADVVGLVHSLGLPVVAEGVEEQAEAERLDALGVAFQQGFLHSRPLRADALLLWWEQGG